MASARSTERPLPADRLQHIDRRLSTSQRAAADDRRTGSRNRYGRSPIEDSRSGRGSIARRLEKPFDPLSVKKIVNERIATSPARAGER
jgi:hypothetical protein